MKSVLEFIIAFIVVFAIGMGIRWLVTRNKKQASAPPSQSNAAPPPPPGQGSFCPSCGASNDASAAFCGSCGAKLR